MLRWGRSLLVDHASPAQLFSSCVLGCVVGSTPFFGAHFWICLGLARLLRLNFATVYAAANISIPPLLPFLGYACARVGGAILGRHGVERHVDAAIAVGVREHLHRFLDVFVAWTVGAPFVGVAIGVVMGTVVATIAARRNAPRFDRDTRETIGAIVARFAGAPRGIVHYARWKLRLDPVYRALDEEVAADARVLDLGAGLGLLGLWLVRGGAAREVRGIEWDASKVALGARACVGTRCTLVEGDARATALEGGQSPYDVVAMVDLLHYFDAENQAQIVDRAIGVLAPTGALMIRDGARGGVGARWTEALERIAVAVGWNRSARAPRWLSFEALRDRLTRAGFAVTVRPLSGPMHPGNVLLIARRRAEDPPR